MNLSSTSSTRGAMDAQPSDEADTRLRGRWLLLARIVWVVIAVLAMGLFIASVPTNFVFLHMLCTGDPATCRISGQITPNFLRALQAVGGSPSFRVILAEK
jgi:hypothetical protein